MLSTPQSIFFTPLFDKSSRSFSLTHTHTKPVLTFSFHSGARSSQSACGVSISGADSRSPRQDADHCRLNHGTGLVAKANTCTTRSRRNSWLRCGRGEIFPFCPDGCVAQLVSLSTNQPINASSPYAFSVPQAI